MKILILGLMTSMFSCGPPSPWANFVSTDYGLTQKNLDSLGSGETEFRDFKIGLIADPQVMPGYLNKVIQSLDKIDDIDFYLILGDLTDRSLRREFEWVSESV